MQVQANVTRAALALGLGADGGMTGGGLLGAIGSLFGGGDAAPAAIQPGAIASTSGAASVAPLDFVMTPLFHRGGVVGEGGTPRATDPSIFAGAPRFHAGGMIGLGPDEVPIIAQRGERVMTAQQQAQQSATANGDGSVTIHQTFNAAGASQMDQVAMARWAAQIKAETLAAVADAKQRGGRYGRAFA